MRVPRFSGQFVRLFLQNGACSFVKSRRLASTFFIAEKGRRKRNCLNCVETKEKTYCCLLGKKKIFLGKWGNPEAEANHRAYLDEITRPSGKKACAHAKTTVEILSLLKVIHRVR